MPGEAPFASGDRVYCPSFPENGSLVVEACGPDADGTGWRLSGRADDGAGIATYFMSAPAENFARCPEGWIEPPVVPAFTECVAYNEVSVSLWQEKLEAWLGGLKDNNPQIPEPEGGF